MNNLQYILNEVTAEVEKPLQRSGIYYRIFARQKSDDSINKKIKEKLDSYKANGKKMQDLFGIRVIVYFREDVELLHDYYKNNFPGYLETSDTNEDIVKAESKLSDLGALRDKVFMPTRLNLVIRMDEYHSKNLKEGLIGSDICSEMIDNTYELQLRSVLSEGWHEVEHDLRYKTRAEKWWQECEVEVQPVVARQGNSALRHAPCRDGCHSGAWPCDHDWDGSGDESVHGVMSVDSGSGGASVFRRAFADSMPVMAGYGTMGFAAGVLLAVQGGLSLPALWAALSSALFISGPLQYLFVDWVRTSLALGSVLFIVVCMNLRYALYGLSLIETFREARLGTRLSAACFRQRWRSPAVCRPLRSAATVCTSRRSTISTGWRA